MLAYQTGIELDLCKYHPDARRREQAQRWCTLMTPVLKAAFTDQAFHGASECLQVFGGHGYIREWGIEQVVRDSRVTMIYEGTNEIQAIDLLVRKVLPDGGAGLRLLLQTLGEGLDETKPREKALLEHLSRLAAVTRSLVNAAATEAQLSYWVAGDYLRAVALVFLDWAWLRIDSKAGVTGAQIWQGPSEALQRWVMPEFDMRLAIIEGGLARTEMSRPTVQC